MKFPCIQRLACAALIAAAPGIPACGFSGAVPQAEAISRITASMAEPREIGIVPRGRSISAGGESLDVFVFAGSPDSVLFRSVSRETLSEYSSLDFREDARVRVSFDAMKTSISISITDSRGTEGVIVRIPEGVDAIASVPESSEEELHVYVIDAGALSGRASGMRALRIEVSFGSVFISEFDGNRHDFTGGPVRNCRLENPVVRERQVTLAGGG